MSLKRVILMRHAQSEEDVNPNLNSEREDSQISITGVGEGQAKGVVSRIYEYLAPYRDVMVYSSPSNRARQTASIISDGLGNRSPKVTVEPRIRNLDWGDATPENIKEIEGARYLAGVLFYQFPGGDNSPTFVKRIGDFVRELLTEGLKADFPEGVVVVTHGFALRIIAKFLLQTSDEDFRWIRNPPNCYLADFQIDPLEGATIRQPLPKREPI